MDDLTDSLAQLSTKAKEWKPGVGFQPQQGSTNASSKTAPAGGGGSMMSPSSLSTQSSPWNPNNQAPQSTADSTTKSASGVNVNASNWVPAGITSISNSGQQEHEQAPQSIQQPPPQVQPIANHEDNSSASIPTTGTIPSPHEQSFISNNPISLPLPKTLLHDNANTATGGSGGAGTSSNNSKNQVPNHLLSKLYKMYHVDCSSQMSPNDDRYKAIPQSFINAMPLENNDGRSTNNSSSTSTNMTTSGNSNRNNASVEMRSSFGYPSSVFKVTNIEDGRLYCLRRFDAVKGVNGIIASRVSNRWTHSRRNIFNPHQQQQQQQRYVLNHPGIVRFYKAFYITQNRALFFIHEYYPNALTLREALFGLKRGESGKLNHDKHHHHNHPSTMTFPPLQESTIWSYITQLVSAIKSIHSGGLAVRVLQLNHILVTHDLGSGFVEESTFSTTSLMTNRVRLRINCVGVVDALESDSRKDVEECQKEDIRCLGRIILSLATGMEIGYDVDDETLNKCDVYMGQTYSPELYNLTIALLARKRMGRLGHVLDADPPMIQHVCRAVGEHALDELDSVHVTVDKMDEALAAEYESGRGLRLLLKLGFVNERPEFGVDTRWSESGDCYVLKLFRDYGKPSLHSYNRLFITLHSYTQKSDRSISSS